MGYIALLGRAVRILLRERSLWHFGLLPALLTVGSLAPAAMQAGTSYLPQWYVWNQMPARLAWILSVALSLLWGILTLVAGLGAQAGLIAMVDEAGQVDRTHLRTGLHAGRRHALRLVFITLLIGMPAGIAAAALCAVIGPFTAGLRAGLLALVLLLGLSAAGILLELAYRRCVLAREGVLGSIASACRLLWARPRRALETWLSLLAVSLGLTALGAPLGLLALALAALLAAVVALALHPLAALLIVGLPALLIASIVLTLLTTAHILFHCTVWTLAYRKIVPGSPDWA